MIDPSPPSAGTGAQRDTRTDILRRAPALLLIVGAIILRANQTHGWEAGVASAIPIVATFLIWIALPSSARERRAVELTVVATGVVGFLIVLGLVFVTGFPCAQLGCTP